MTSVWSTYTLVTALQLFKSEVQFGHACAKSGGNSESAQARSSCLLNLPCRGTAGPDAQRHTFRDQDLCQIEGVPRSQAVQERG